eukprot:PhF_6_TR21007/c2_g1_i2/m.30176
MYTTTTTPPTQLPHDTPLVFPSKSSTRTLLVNTASLTVVPYYRHKDRFMPSHTQAHAVHSTAFISWTTVCALGAVTVISFTYRSNLKSIVNKTGLEEIKFLFFLNFIYIFFLLV